MPEALDIIPTMTKFAQLVPPQDSRNRISFLLLQEPREGFLKVSCNELAIGKLNKRKDTQIFLLVWLGFLVLLGIELRTLCKAGKGSTTELST